MADIAAASAEQSSGIDQVNQAVTQMDEVTQQNAALVEQAAAAAESLEEQAETLSEAVAQFRLDSDKAPRASIPSVRSPAKRPSAPIVKQSKTNVKVSASNPTGDDEWIEF